MTSHAFLAMVEDAIVLLDSRSDDYIMVEPALVPGFLAQLSESKDREAAASSPVAPGLAELIGELGASHRAELGVNSARGL